MFILSIRTGAFMFSKAGITTLLGENNLIWPKVVYWSPSLAQLFMLVLFDGFRGGLGIFSASWLNSKT